MSVALTATEAIRLVLQRGRSHGWRSVNRTQAAKLLYFIDLRAVADPQFEHPITTVDWIWDNYGPFSREIQRALDSLAESGTVVETQRPTGVGTTEYTYALAKSTSATDAPVESRVVDIIDAVLDEHRGWSATKLRDAAYATPPMLRVVHSGHRGDALDLFAGTDVENSAIRHSAATIVPDDFDVEAALSSLANTR